LEKQRKPQQPQSSLEAISQPLPPVFKKIAEKVETPKNEGGHCASRPGKTPNLFRLTR
jgi:hypothetical protein